MPATLLYAAQRVALRNTWILYILGASAAMARIIIRTRLTRRLEPEELLMVIALCAWTVDTSMITLMTLWGTNQMPPSVRASLSPSALASATAGAKAVAVAWCFYSTAIWACKFSLWFFYRKLTVRVQAMRWINSVGYLLLATYVACLLSVFLVCTPFERNWQVRPDPGEKCTSGQANVIVIGVLNVVTDVVLLAVPLPLVWGLKVDWKRKLLLIALFGLGIFVIVASILRMVFSIQGGTIYNTAFWSMIETAVGFIVANAPGIKSVFTRKNSSKGSYEMSSKTRPPGSRFMAHAVTTQIRGGEEAREVQEDEEKGLVIKVKSEVTFETCEGDGRSQSSRQGGEKEEWTFQPPVSRGSLD